jgi:hypothetical protein
MASSSDESNAWTKGSDLGTAWFHAYVDRLEAQPKDLPLRCPCCFCKTLDERGGFSICPVCFWEDDGQDDYDAEVVRGGPNGRLSLTEARANYRRFSACDERSLEHVRQALPSERPDASPGAVAHPGTAAARDAMFIVTRRAGPLCFSFSSDSEAGRVGHGTGGGG